MCGGIRDISGWEVCYDPVVPRQENIHLKLPQANKGLLMLGPARAMQVKTTDGIIRVYDIPWNEDLALAIV